MAIRGKVDEAFAEYQRVVEQDPLDLDAQWGDADNALSWLEPGYVIRDPGLQYLGQAFLFEPIKEDPRFKVFLKKMNF